MTHRRLATYVATARRSPVGSDDHSVCRCRHADMGDSAAPASTVTMLAAAAALLWLLTKNA